MDAALAAAAALADPAAKQAAYEAALGRAVGEGDVGALTQFAEHVLSSPDVPLLLSRTLVTSYAASLAGLPPPSRRAAATAALDRLAARAASYAEAAAGLREQVAGAAEAEEDWSGAAAALAAIDAEAAGLRWPPHRRCAHAVRVAMLHLEADDPGAADAYVKRAAALVAEVKDLGLELQYRTSAARVLDARRDFGRAAAAYLAVARLATAAAEGGGGAGGGPAVSASDVAAALQAAAAAALLAPPSPQRSRVLAALVADDRTAASLGEALRAALVTVHHDRLLPPAAVTALEAVLAPHQRAVGADGLTAAARAALEHNLVAAGKVYANIYLDRLGELLGVPPALAEATAARMAAAGRLAARLDQVAGLLTFTAGADGGGGGRGASAAATTTAAAGAAAAPAAPPPPGEAEEAFEALARWDAAIAGVCREVEAAVEPLAAGGGG